LYLNQCLVFRLPLCSCILVFILFVYYFPIILFYDVFLPVFSMYCSLFFPHFTCHLTCTVLSFFTQMMQCSNSSWCTLRSLLKIRLYLSNGIHLKILKLKNEIKYIQGLRISVFMQIYQCDVRFRFRFFYYQFFKCTTYRKHEIRVFLGSSTIKLK